MLCYGLCAGTKNGGAPEPHASLHWYTKLSGDAGYIKTK